MHEVNFQVGISADAWQELDTNWQKVAAQVFLNFVLVLKSSISQGSPLAMAVGHWLAWRLRPDRRVVEPGRGKQQEYKVARWRWHGGGYLA